MKTKRKTAVRFPAGFRLIDVRELPKLKTPGTCDPRCRRPSGELVYAEIHRARREPDFMAVPLTRALVKNENAGAEKNVPFVYWYFEQHGGGYSGIAVSALDEEPRFIVVQQQS